MGLFDPPYVNIRKRVPQNALVAFAAVEAFVRMNLEGENEVQQDHCVACVTSVWACNAAMTGDFQLSQRDYQMIQGFGVNSSKPLPAYLQDRVIEIIRELKEKGVISSE